ncbi:MAG: transcription antitermination factor NusB [Pseudomonadota bacterium]
MSEMTTAAERSPMAARTAARLAAVQALYQMETGGGGVDATVREFRAHRLGTELDGDAIIEADAAFFEDVLRGVVEMQLKIDPYIERRLSKGWTLSRLDATARAILRCGVFELVRRADVPAKAIIDEYVELAHDFFEGDEPRFVNGVLDAAAKDVRADELA